MERRLTISILFTSFLQENLQLSGKVRKLTKTRNCFPCYELMRKTSLLLPSSGVKMFLHERYQLQEHLHKQPKSQASSCIVTYFPYFFSRITESFTQRWLQRTELVLILHYA